MVEKKETINSTFKKIYGEELLTKGFVYCSKLGVFIRVIGNELIQYVGIRKMGQWGKDTRGFRVYASVLSLYVNEISKENITRLGSPITLFERNNIPDIHEYNDATLEEQVEKSMENFMRYVYGKMCMTVDLESYIRELKYVFRLPFAGASQFLGDSLALVKADNHDDFLDVLEIEVDRALTFPIYKSTSREKIRDHFYYGIVESTAGERDKVYNDPELYAAALKECEIRKERNLQTLRELKVIK